MTIPETIETERPHGKLTDDELLAEMENIGAQLEGFKDTKYDQLSFGPLKEVFNEADLRRCLTPAHSERVEVQDKWTTATVKSLATKYGAEALRIVDHARMETRGRLIFKRRDK